MDRLVDEAEGLAVDSSSSVCSGAGGGGRLETTTDQQLSLLNSITASDLTGQSWDLVLQLWKNLRIRNNIKDDYCINDFPHLLCCFFSPLNQHVS